MNVEDIYVPVARRKEMDPEKVELEAEKLLEGAEERPIHVRQSKGKTYLVKGIHRLEARKALGEEEIQTHIVRALQH